MTKKNSFASMTCLSILVFVMFRGLFPGFVHAQKVVLSKRDQGEIEKIESKLSAEKRQLEKMDSQEKSLLAELADLEREIAHKKEEVAELEREIHSEEGRLRLLRQRLETMKLATMAISNRVADKLVRLYKHVRMGYVRALAEATNLSQFWRRVEYLKIIMEQDRAALLSAAEEAGKHREEIGKIEAELAETRKIMETNRAERLLLKKDLEKKVLYLMKIHNEREFHETAVSELKAAAEGLKQTLLHVEKKDRHKTEGPRYFGACKGKLPYPLVGRLVDERKVPASYRTRNHGGIALEGSPGADVKAVFPGVVAFSGRLKGYGDLIIIDHGSRFFTVSAHLARRTKMEGDLVKEGDVVGQVGRDVKLGRARMYFEIRRAGKSLNTRDWLKPQ